MANQSNPSASGVRIRALQPGEDATAFRTLNEEWIERLFFLEDTDRAQLNDPEAAFLRKGGFIFLAELESETVGCVGLLPAGQGVYELSKMAVTPKLRGAGIGRALLLHAMAKAKEIGAVSLFLGSSRKLPSAVHLYESVGFQHIPAERLPLHYTRADVFMEILLR